MASEKTVAQVLSEAADIVERDGWCQGDYFNGRACCLLGACARARYPTISRDGYVGGMEGYQIARVEDEVRPYLVGIGMSGYFSHVWNDEPGRTKAEVVAALREAARRAEQEAATHGV